METNYFAVLVFFVILIVGLSLTRAIYGAQADTEGRLTAGVFLVLALIVSYSIKIAGMSPENKQNEKRTISET